MCRPVLRSFFNQFAEGFLFFQDTDEFVAQALPSVHFMALEKQNKQLQYVHVTLSFKALFLSILRITNK
jgi:hypothetical protein